MKYTKKCGNKAGKQLLRDAKIPNKITYRDRVFKLFAATTASPGIGNAYYRAEDELVMTRFDGSVASDIEEVIEGALLESVEDGELIYADRLTKKYLKEVI